MIGPTSSSSFLFFLDEALVVVEPAGPLPGASFNK
jgi:hypothetical protein